MLVYAREGISGSLDKNTWMMRRDPGWAADMRVIPPTQRGSCR